MNIVFVVDKRICPYYYNTYIKYYYYKKEGTEYALEYAGSKTTEQRTGET